MNKPTALGWTWAVVVFSIASFAFTQMRAQTQALAHNDHAFAARFPLPEVLKPNVAFWKKIYAQYSSNQVLIHDAEDLDIIYEVVDFRNLFSNPDDVSERTKWKRIERIKKRYKRKLYNIADKLQRRQSLTEEERRIVTLFGDRATPFRLRKAARNLRGQRGMKEKFHEGLRRSGLYFDYISEIFKRHNLPQELIMLPHVESSFNYKAYSKYGAAGIWQFTRSTGRLFMKIGYDVDERLDPILSTEAAAKLLKRNYQELQSWPLAITAYNHGLYGMKRAKRKFGDDLGKIVRYYKSRTFGFASRNFYAEFLAALEVATDYEDYFGDVKFHQPMIFQTFVTDKYYTVQSILRAFNLSMDEFKAFNPALRPPVLRGERRIPKGYALRLPDRPDVDERALWAALSSREGYRTQVFSQWYKVRRGDNLSAIARRFGVPLYMLMEYNNIRNAHRIYAGQILKIPESARAARLANKRNRKKSRPTVLVDATPKPNAPAVAPKPVAESIQPAASPAVPATAAADQIEPVEIPTGLAAPEHEVAPPNMRVELAAGDDVSLILVPAEEPTASVPDETEQPQIDEPISEWIRVEPEETLGHYAEWLEIPTQRLRRINHLAYGEEIRIGQRIKLSFEKVSPEEFMRRRYEYLKSIEEDFFSSYRVENVKVHKVRRGQNIWYITHRLYDVPLWLVAKYNPDRDLQNLHPGDEIMIPVVTTIDASMQ
ncbi:MAG: transglycosylase SLT domain-containing protein [candidate division KSB1 bacterium]|nr:transglycosylase SLT domain-containing protein [candidate division KSB1 bacterium]